MGHEGADGGEAAGEGVVGESVEAGRGRLGEAVAASELAHAEAVDHEAHQVARHGGAGDDAGAYAGEVGLGEAPFGGVGVGRLEERVEHGGDAVEGGAAFLAEGAEGGARVEDLGRVDDLAAVGEDGEEAEHKAEAVEERGRAAEHVGGGETHAVANETGVVDEVARRGAV